MDEVRQRAADDLPEQGLLVELAPGVTAAEVRAKTEPQHAG